MKFLCLAYGDESGWKSLSKEKQDEVLAADERIRQRGNFMSIVLPSTVVRAWDGTPKTSPGPFAKGDVPLAGFSIIEAHDLEEAVAMVSKTPCAVAKGAIEVWPLKASE
jgi:hypothetical protein